MNERPNRTWEHVTQDDYGTITYYWALDNHDTGETDGYVFQNPDGTCDVCDSCGTFITNVPTLEEAQKILEAR